MTLYTYDRRKSPILPLSDGDYKFLHHSNNRKQRIIEYELQSFSLGKLKIPSGQLIIADPFFNLRRTGQLMINCPKGEFEVFQTLAIPKNNEMENPECPWVSYLSIVFDKDKYEMRKLCQNKEKEKGLDPSLKRHLINRLSLSSEGTIDDDEEFDLKEVFPGLNVQSGSCLLVDKVQFEAGMPSEERGSWYATLFEHGNHESWFSFMDNPEHLREGAANFELPLKPESYLGTGNLILSQTGKGDGRYVVFAELNADSTDVNNPLAYHIDFEVIPFDPINPALKK